MRRLPYFPERLAVSADDGELVGRFYDQNPFPVADDGVPDGE